MREQLLPTVDLYEEIYRLVRQIPRGMVSTAREISEALGDTKAVRAVSETIETAEPSQDRLVHRVVSETGRPLCISRSPEVCLELLRQEGVDVDGGTIIDLEKHLFSGFEAAFPLKRLQELQEEISQEVVLEDRSAEALEVVAGVDVAYRGRQGFGACVVMDRGFRVLDETAAEMEVRFPYVSSYLAFREGPLIMRTLERLDTPFDALMINGHGIAHPRGCGIATHIGFLFGGKPTIGVAARELFSEVGRVENRVVGEEIRRAGHGVLYISPGNNITLKKSLETVEAFLGKHRLPEPLWRAHIKARKLSKVQ
jgi:deoxyribonuclease V